MSYGTCLFVCTEWHKRFVTAFWLSRKDKFLTKSVLLPLVTSVLSSTKYGSVEGLTISRPNAIGQFKSVSKFLGVPFAAPLVGILKAQQPPKHWKPTVRQAGKHGPICLQLKTYEYLLKPFSTSFSYSRLPVS